MKQTLCAVAVLALAGCVTQPATLDPGTPVAAYAIQNEGTNYRVVTLTGPVHETSGTAPEIAARAHICAARTLNFGDVKAQGSSASLFGTADNAVITLGGGQLIEVYDPANGIVVANTRVNYWAGLIPYSAQARVNVEAREGRFRVLLSEPQKLQRSTGYAPVGNFNPVMQLPGTHWQAALDRLSESANKLTDCIKAPSADW